jgi:poly-beta-1,6-N-acetyl-D-glucosamine synthase
LTGPLPAYAVVTAARDEGEWLPQTAASLIAQQHRPAQWVIVDDGSTDGTVEIANDLARRHEWITVLATGRSEGRARGAPVVAAFKQGLGAVSAEHEFVVKLDADLFLAPHYFAWVAGTFGREPRAGLVGGRLLVFDGREWEYDNVGRHTVHGAIKGYRRSAYDEIGGLHETMGWDGIDEFQMTSRGWEVRVLSELLVLHYKQRGARQGSLRPRWEEGRGMRQVGYRGDFGLVRIAWRGLTERPRVLSAVPMLAAFAWHTLRRTPRIPDPQAIAAIRDYQRRRLVSLLTRRYDPTLGNAGDGPAFWSAEQARDDLPAG